MMDLGYCSWKRNQFINGWIAFNVSFSLSGSDGALIEEGLDWSDEALYWPDALPDVKPMVHVGIEPQPAAWQASVLTTTPRRQS